MLFWIQTLKLHPPTAVELLELLGGVCVWIRTTPCDSWKVPWKWSSTPSPRRELQLGSPVSLENWVGQKNPAGPCRTGLMTPGHRDSVGPISPMSNAIPSLVTLLFPELRMVPGLCGMFQILVKSRFPHICASLRVRVVFPCTGSGSLPPHPDRSSPPPKVDK